MATAAAKVDVVLSVNATQYSKQLDEAQKQLDQLRGKAVAAGHGTVSSVQAASASLRLLEGGITNNIRAVERFITTIPGVGAALKVAFPLVGAAAFAGLIGSSVEKVVKFVDAAQKMPAAIKQGFQALQLEAQSADDRLKLVNDQLQNSISKLQGKPQNNLAIGLDEARIKADDLAKSLENDANKVKALLDQNKLGFLQGLVSGNESTANVRGSIESYQTQLNGLGGDLIDANHRGDKTASDNIQKQIDDKRKAYLDYLNSEIKTRTSSRQVTVGGDFAAPETTTLSYAQEHGDQTANLNILRGARSLAETSADTQSDQDKNGALTTQKARLEAAKAAQAQENALAQKRLEAFDKEISSEKRKGEESVANTYAFWLNKVSAFRKGSEQYQAVLDKIRQSRGALQDEFDGIRKRDSISNTEGAEILARANENITRNSQKRFDEQGASGRESNDSSIDQYKNTALEQEAQVAEAAGKSITHYAAALQLAAIHADELKKTLFALGSNVSIAQYAVDAAAGDPDRLAAAQKQLAQAQKAQADAKRQGTIQAGQDANAINPASTSPFVGAADALNEFVNSTRDAATQMRDLTNNALRGFNDVLVQQLTTRHTGLQTRQALGNYGAGLARSVAGAGIQKVEGTALSALGFGSSAKLGTQANPIYVRMADKVSSAVGSVGGLLGKIGSSGGLLGKIFGGGSKSSSSSGGLGGNLIGDLAGVVPFLASGGPINGPAVVGEEGPELFNPGTSGTIIPNHKLSSSMNIQGGNTINIDASGSTDPAQVHAAVMRGIAAAAPHLINASVRSVKDDRRRRSSLSR